MKSRLSGYLLIAVLFSFISCSKELSKEKNTPGTQIPNGDFYATIDGTQWNADSLQLVLVSNSGVSISGLSKTGEQITMLLPTFKTGNYTLNALSAPIAIYSNLLTNVSTVFISNTGAAGGNVTISKIDSVKHLVSGTFMFTLINPSNNLRKSITAGVFNSVPYTVDTTGGITPSATDTLEASVGGVQFNSAQVVASITNGTLFIAGISSDGVSDIALGMPPGITPGTYSMDFATGMYYGVYNPNSSTTLLSQMNGTLTIISNNTVSRRIIGTFIFIASPLMSGTPVTITNGYFSVSY
ncbi:MAG TPA: DUF6252 family protein [Puia sp.]|jgi:hypothetical protein|nr:DUF6252 family protein [Puia sp.]